MATSWVVRPVTSRTSSTREKSTAAGRTAKGKGAPPFGPVVTALLKGRGSGGLAGFVAGLLQ